MDKLRNFEIGFKGLKDGDHTFTFGLDDHFFESIEGSLVDGGELVANVQLNKQTTMLTLVFDIKGKVKTICDRCLDPLELPVKYNGKLYVKFGEAYDEPTDEIIVLPHEEHQLNVGHLLYEYIGLSLPMQKVHKNNGCDPQMIAKLKEFKDINIEEGQSSDPRWEELKKLIDKNK